VGDCADCWSDDAVMMAYEAEEVYEYDDPLEFEIEQLKTEAGSCFYSLLFVYFIYSIYLVVVFAK